MDIRSIDKMIKSQERFYIWLEKELKRNLTVTTLAVLFFFLVPFFGGFSKAQCVIVLAAALLLNGFWCYYLYRRKYKDYLSIVRYLEEFEAGNYEYRMERSGIKEGIHSQILEQLERMGRAFGRLKNRLIKEQASTKEVVTDISHQLKTPAAALLLNYELLWDDSLTDEEKQEFFIRGKKETVKLVHLLNTLTNLSQLETGLIQICPQKASLKKTLINAVNGVYAKADKKSIEIEMTKFNDILLEHDPKWTAEAISNVLDNAVKYSPFQAKIQVRTKRLASYVLIEVEDEGIGIPKEDYAHIFKRFYRGKSLEVEKEEGAGVGLYLARQILETQGGSIRAADSRNKGTIIQMMIPAGYMYL